MHCQSDLDRLMRGYLLVWLFQKDREGLLSSG